MLQQGVQYSELQYSMYSECTAPALPPRASKLSSLGLGLSLGIIPRPAYHRYDSMSWYCITSLSLSILGVFSITSITNITNITTTHHQSCSARPSRPALHSFT